jgi:GNAT superfamily N-acetyltransferase
VDEQPVWSVHCFYIKKEYRNKGLSVPLLKAAAAYASSMGATLVEGYPLEIPEGKTPDVFAWTGLAQIFLRAGFKEVARRSKTRPIMRLNISDH